MGQRLVVQIIKNDKPIAAIYYHWSAYFASTIDELAKLSRAILDAKKHDKDELLAILDMLEQVKILHVPRIGGAVKDEIRRGGVVNKPEEIKAAQHMFPNREIKQEFIDRNNGLIAFTEQGIKDFMDWSEGDASINLDTLEICNEVNLDPYPFEFDAEYEEDEYGEQCVSRYLSGRITINEKTCPVDAFDCTCESILELHDFMNREYAVFRDTHGDKPW